VVRSKLAKVLREQKFIGKCAVTSLPSSDVEIKSMRLPNMPEAELAPAVAFEARERFRDLAEDVVLRSIPVGRVGRAGDEQQEVIVLAASKAAIDGRLKLLTELGLVVAGMEPAANSFFRPFERFLQRASDAPRSNAFVDLGGRGSRIIIAQGGNIVFLKTCPVGGEVFDDLVAQALSIAPRRAGALRRRCLQAEGDSPVQSDRASVMEAVKPALDQLGKEIGLCLRYFAVTFRGERPERLTCGGSEVTSPAVLDHLAEVVQMPVEVGEPWRGIDCRGLFSDADLASGLPEWTAAVGLALKDTRRAGERTKVA
jgi:type IV pilus assembly protein PilM